MGSAGSGPLEPSTRAHRRRGHLGLFGGWVLAKQSGIAFIDGMEAKEPVAFADGLAAALAVLAVICCAVALRRSKWIPGLPGRALLGASCVAIVAIAVPGMLAAASPGHHGTTSAAATADHHATSGSQAAAEPAAASAVPPVPYDPAMPIDLGGAPGVTLAQQARAENLIANTLAHLPQYADPTTAEAAGYRSIHDGGTGYEHYINSDFRTDGRVLDPDRPESLVYQVRGGQKELVAAMYMAEPGTTLDTTPELGGALTQWHIHDNLCFAPDGRVAGITSPDGSCAPGLIKPEPVPMIHVWIVPHPCGPFAALDGIAGGSIRPGEERLCDTAHGGH